MLACAHPAFDGSVILFQNIIEVLHRSMPAILLQSALGFEPLDGWWITGVLIGIDYARRRMVLSPPKALARKRSAAAASRLSERRKSIVAPLESRARYKYTHLPLTRMKVSSARQLSLVGRSRGSNRR